MANHRCTRCKQDSYTRHKWHGGVYCDSCISYIRGDRPHTGGRSWFGSMWDMIVDFATLVFRHKRVKRVCITKGSALRSLFKSMETKARSIPFNPSASVPQKH